MTEAAIQGFQEARKNYFDLMEKKMKDFVLSHPEMSNEEVTEAMMKTVWDIAPTEPRQIDNLWCLNLDFTKRVRSN